MIPLAEMSRLAGRIFPCFHMGLIPPAEMKFYHWRLRNVFISVKKHNYLAILEYLFSKKKHCFSNVFDTFIIQYQHQAIGKKCKIKRQNPKFISDFIPVSGIWRVHMGKFSSRLPMISANSSEISSSGPARFHI